jgi:hypothetical protein
VSVENDRVLLTTSAPAPPAASITPTSVRLPERFHPHSRDQNRRGIGKSQSKWTDSKMETPGSFVKRRGIGKSQSKWTACTMDTPGSRLAGGELRAGGRRRRRRLQRRGGGVAQHVAALSAPGGCVERHRARKAASADASPPKRTPETAAQLINTPRSADKNAAHPRRCSGRCRPAGCPRTRRCGRVALGTAARARWRSRRRAPSPAPAPPPRRRLREPTPATASVG